MHLSWLSLLTAITDLGDSAVISSVVLLGAPYLALCGKKREAVMLLLAFCTTSAIMVALKMAILVCYNILPFPGLISPSGHTAMTICVLGMVTVIIARDAHRKLRYAAIALYIVIALGVMISRYKLGYHSRSEIVVGFLVGALLLGLFAYLLLKHPPSAATGRLRFHAAAFAGCIAITMLIVSGIRLPAEDMIDATAWRLNAFIDLCS